jgi:hypothetical protein
MSTAEMHQNASWRIEVACRGCGQSFLRARPWSAFCKPSCRQAFHRSKLPPATLIKRVADLEARVAELERLQTACARIAEKGAEEIVRTAVAVSVSDSRKPPPPHEYLDARQERVHSESGVARVAKSTRVRLKGAGDAS